MSRQWIAAASCAVVGSALATSANAALVTVDFNDVSAGTLAGKAGGTGTTGTWAASDKPQVVAGNLAAPASTNYTVAQSAGTAQSVRTTATGIASGDGQTTRALSDTLGGTVWFSFLVNPNDSAARAGISFNASGAAAGGARLTAVGGTQLFVSYAPTTAGVFVPATLTTGVAHLIVGQVVVDENGGTNERLRIWVDPDVSTLTEDTTANRVFNENYGNWVGAGITSLAVHSYGTSGGGTVDAVRVSNNASAFADVTGVPEPTSLSFAALAAGTLLRRRRRQAR